jgi:CheY-like chemotaxis protein
VSFEASQRIAPEGVVVLVGLLTQILFRGLSAWNDGLQEHRALVFDKGYEVHAVLAPDDEHALAGVAAGVRVPPPPHRIAALILVVDDETDLRQLTADLLSCNGYDVVQAGHGRDAIAKLIEHSPDLVVLDLNMPVMDGWQFRAEQLRLRDGHLTAIPVLLLTGEDRSDYQLRTLKAVGFIKKPFDADELLHAIQTALPHHRGPLRLPGAPPID